MKLQLKDLELLATELMDWLPIHENLKTPADFLLDESYFSLHDNGVSQFLCLYEAGGKPPRIWDPTSNLGDAAMLLMALPNFKFKKETYTVRGDFMLDLYVPGCECEGVGGVAVETFCSMICGKALGCATYKRSQR